MGEGRQQRGQKGDWEERREEKLQSGHKINIKIKFEKCYSRSHGKTN